MAALILPGQFASWQNGLVHAVWQGKELSEFSSVNGFAKTVTPAGEAIRLTGTQYMTRRLPAGFNFPLTFVSVFRRNVASPSRVLASVGSDTQRHMLYFASGNFLALYSAAGAATGQALGSGISDTANVYFAAGRVSSAASRDVFVNGVFYSPNTATANTTPMNVHAIGAYWNNDAPAAGFTSDADILFSGLWNRALSNAEILDLHQSWRRITRPAQRRIWVPVSTGGPVTVELTSSVSSIASAGITLYQSPVALSLKNATFSTSFNVIEVESFTGLSLTSSTLNVESETTEAKRTLSTEPARQSAISQEISIVTDAVVPLETASIKASSLQIQLPVVLSLDDAINQIVFNKLKSLGYSGTVQDMLSVFFGGTGSLPDRENLWLVSQTGSTGPSIDLWKKHLNSLGYSGAVAEMLKQFWMNY